MCKQSSFFFCICLVCFSQSLFAQKLIALHHTGTASFFTTLQSAYDAAVNGDTLYIPGGNFDGITLQKSLALIGVGHHPDSTVATGRTILSSLSIYAGGSNSFIVGILFSNTISPVGDVSGVVISRCYLNKGIYLQGGGQKSNWIITENWVGQDNTYGYSIYPYNGNLSNCLLSNNVFQSVVSNITSSEISNNIFLYFLGASNSIIRNNIFHGNGSNYVDYTSTSQWYNNLNSGINGGPSGGGNTGSGNYLVNAPLTSVFTNFGNSDFYQNDFHVVNTAYLGNDGTPVGIYGGPFPWKAGSLPFNPHIRAKTIGSTTNPDGTLHINVTVKAQGN